MTIPLWEQTDITLEKLLEANADIKKKLEELPKDAPENTHEGRLRSFSKERLDLAGEWHKILGFPLSRE